MKRLIVVALVVVLVTIMSAPAALFAMGGGGGGNGGCDDKKRSGKCEYPKKKVTICHKKKNTIRVSENAVPAHLAHGDKLGKCDKKNNDNGHHNGGHHNGGNGKR